MYAKGVRPRYCYSWLCFSTLPICSHSWSVHLVPWKVRPENRDFGKTLLERAQALHPRKLHSQNVTEMAELLRAEVFDSGNFIDTNNKHLDVPGS